MFFSLLISYICYFGWQWQVYKDRKDSTNVRNMCIQLQCAQTTHNLFLLPWLKISLNFGKKFTIWIVVESWSNYAFNSLCFVFTMKLTMCQIQYLYDVYELWLNYTFGCNSTLDKVLSSIYKCGTKLHVTCVNRHVQMNHVIAKMFNMN